MKKNSLFLFLLATLFASTVSSCKKEDDDNLGGQPSDGQVEIPSDAQGAFYAINSTSITDFGGFTDTTRTGIGMGWFDSYTQTKNGGAVTSNGDSLFLTNPFTNTPNAWYTASNVDFYTGNVAWKVQGNTANSIAAFTHTDNTAWPTVTSLTVPSSVNTSSALNISFNASGYDQLIATLRGSAGTVNKVVSPGATSAIFSAAEVQQAFGSTASAATVQVMPIKLTSATYGGKKYYFVKQQAYAKFIF